MEEQTADNKKLMTWFIAVITVVFLVFVWFYELGTAQSAQRKLERYGDMLAPEMESMDRRGADRSARLIVLLGRIRHPRRCRRRRRQPRTG